MNQYKYITDITKKDFEKLIVIPCINNEGFRTIIIKNSLKKDYPGPYSTRYLNIKKNITLTNNGELYYVHLISCKESNEYLNRCFDIIYEYLFKKIDAPINELEFSELINTIEELFGKASQNIEQIQIGTAGELITLMYLYEKGFKNIFDKYHKNSYSKHDIEINERTKIEVKTTVKEGRIHRFSHSQLNDDNMEVFISSVRLFTVENGMTLYQLFRKVIEISSNYETTFSLRKIMNYCNLDVTNQGIVFNYDESFNNVKLMRREDLPRFIESIPNGIINLSYDVICDLVPESFINELF